jgi:hypothetical protein
MGSRWWVMTWLTWTLIWGVINCVSVVVVVGILALMGARLQIPYVAFAVLMFAVAGIIAVPMTIARRRDRDIIRG